MGITPIEYRPWKGERTSSLQRFLVISKKVLRQKLKSKWVLAILIIGVILTHVFSIIFATIIPHEKLTPEMMVGDDPEEVIEVSEAPIFMDGYFEFFGMVTIKGSLYIEGNVIGIGSIKGDGSPLSGTIRGQTETDFLIVSGTLVLDGELELYGGITGIGNIIGNFTISGEGETQITSPNIVNGNFELNGWVGWQGQVNIDGRTNGTGTLFGDGTSISNTTVTENGFIMVNGTITVNGSMDISGSIEGAGYLDGSSLIVQLGGSSVGVQEQEGPFLSERQGGYLKNFLLVIFTMMLASLVCSDLIAEDLGDNSFILFFSRPIKSRDYLAGKIIGALWILGLFCFLPLVIYCLAVMGTQSSGDYGTSLGVLGSTIGAGLLTSFIFVPYGILISSMTKRKSYATMGIFMSFFVLTIIGAIFQNFDKNWVLIDPTRVLFYSYDIMYGYSVPEGINAGILGAVLFCIMIIPLILVYLRIHFKAVGK